MVFEITPSELAAVRSLFVNERAERQARVSKESEKLIRAIEHSKEPCVATEVRSGSNTTSPTTRATSLPLTATPIRHPSDTDAQSVEASEASSEHLSDEYMTEDHCSTAAPPPTIDGASDINIRQDRFERYGRVANEARRLHGSLVRTGPSTPNEDRGMNGKSKEKNTLNAALFSIQAADDAGGVAEPPDRSTNITNVASVSANYSPSYDSMRVTHVHSPKGHIEPDYRGKPYERRQLLPALAHTFGTPSVFIRPVRTNSNSTP
jgi:hypothetical protein